MSDEKKKLLIYDEEENVYYEVFDFLDFLTKGKQIQDPKDQEGYEEFLEQTYVFTKYKLDYLKAITKLYEGGLIERVVEDENGNEVVLNDEQIVEQDIEMAKTINGLGNTIEEYEFFFDEERLENLNKKVKYIWDKLHEDSLDL